MDAKQVDVMVADASHEVYVDKILDTIREAAKDVYKRQFLFWAVIGIILPDRRRLAKRNNLFAFISICRFSESVFAKDSQKAVSYTHLDVYKRQMLTNNGAQAGHDSPEIRIRGVGTFEHNDPMVLIDGVERCV